MLSAHFHTYMVACMLFEYRLVSSEFLLTGLRATDWQRQFESLVNKIIIVCESFNNFSE